MNTQPIKDALHQTLDDRRLSRGEKRALGQILGHIQPDEHTLNLLRSEAFKLARGSFNDVQAGEVMDWLEDVVKLLQAQSEQGQRATKAECRFSPDDDCPTRIAGLFATARRAVDVCVFTITDDRISEAVIDAHRRGIDVRIITDDDKAFDAGSDVSRLERAGVSVRVDRSRFHMHHKFAIFDRDLLLTGSYNWTRGAANNNEENFILTGDRRYIEPFGQMFEKLWERFA